MFNKFLLRKEMEIVTSRRLAEFIPCHESLIPRWRDLGMPYRVEGTQYVYNVESVLKWLEGRNERLRRSVQWIREREGLE